MIKSTVGGEMAHASSSVARSAVQIESIRQEQEERFVKSERDCIR